MSLLFFSLSLFTLASNLSLLLISIEQKASVKSKIPVPPPSDVQVLDLHNFEEVVEKSGKNVLVAFTVRFFGDYFVFLSSC